LPPELFGAVLIRRRSVRSYRRVAVDLSTVSDLLHHAARRTPWFHHASLGAHALHSYPDAGALAELELYLIAHDIDELQQAVYRYDPVSHNLDHRREVDQPTRSELENWVRNSLNRPPESAAPPLLFLVTAVAHRLTSKYGRNGLLLANQDLGCLYQTLYLVATTLGLGPCAIGTGPGPKTSEWLGTDNVIEPVIGGFVIGQPA
jgi:SagB-type dehydrogenase family enzyme